MKYTKVIKGIFLERPNRFIAKVIINGNEETVHVKNTGRCREILRPGTEVILEETDNKNRKTKYSLIGAYKGNVLINIDSQIPNMVISEAIRNKEIYEFQNITFLKREVTFKNSRFDIYCEGNSRKMFIEVKGVTLEKDKTAMFPDAPTQRGLKHVKELMEAVKMGFEGFVIFLIQMKGVTCFTPNYEMDIKFSEGLKKASKNGVKILAFDSIVEEDGIILGESINVRF
ncbi:DNA/RNA nuclease SfsA [Pseudobacteroides cellulosolvens]|uniref:Sugar fermentation stimulation protein homolog n=1 Tax=Pseudobacteroides cellulosolvens ATCC 35603 = DSM 2933 TaxID=398512 RepID=A0A0L6JRV9_9FIRM|nr:DNA/RNA nuclease SfsA [Pseudobacteroides cellulosolvens]KNY28489.1 Sugar fermentation stimulation protein A [Pseudobacteroides cellulosolvens ATCC 35603 = DSM 2933]